MPAPFYNAIKGTTAGTPGTGAFTPNAAATLCRAWSNVPTGWIGMVQFVDGTAWELSWSYWNGTTLSRASTQLFDSSTGSAISLTSAATAAMVIDAADVQSHVGTTKLSAWFSNGTTFGGTPVGITALTPIGSTNGSAAPTATNYLTQQARSTATSATTANAQAGIALSTVFGIVSTTAGMGGMEYVIRFGASTLPTGPRLFVGLTTATISGSTLEPSAFVANFMVFGQDSTDTNIQLMTKDGTTAHKVDTGIPLVVNGWYEASVWCDPGSNKVYGLLIRLDTGAIWYGSTVTNCPVTGSLMAHQPVGGLNGTDTGTAFVMNIGSMSVRAGQ